MWWIHRSTCDDDEDMILATTCLDDINGGIDDGCERSRSSETDVRHNRAVACQSVLEACAGAVIRIEAEHSLVVGSGIAEAKAGDIVIVVE